MKTLVSSLFQRIKKTYNPNIIKTQLLVSSLFQIIKKTSQIHQIHAQFITTNFISDHFLATQLLNSITSNTTHTHYADSVFTQIHQPNPYIYNTMIKFHFKNSQTKRAFQIYIEMRKNGSFGDDYTYPVLLKVCGTMKWVFEGTEIHGDVLKGGALSDVFVVNGLIGMYCKCGEIGWAKMVFDGFLEKDLVSWNTMLSGFVGCGDIEKAQRMFDEMPNRDVVSWSIMVDGYAKKLGDVIRARELFDNMPIRDLISWNAMIDGYTKAGEMVAARQLFDRMPKKNVNSWSTIIDGYVQHGSSKEALDLFRQMLCQNFKPDKILMAGIAMACGQLGALDQGRWIHMFIKKHLIKMDIVLETALVDMYMKCGSPHEACNLFNNMSERNAVSWTVMIVGLGMHGFGQEALACFSRMETERVRPDDMIFIGVLTACSHAGLVNEGLKIFDSMKNKYGIEPKLEHYGCVVDLHGRAGQIDEALAVIKSMPMKPNSAIWGSLLMACHAHKNVVRAEVAVERLAEIGGDDSGVYVLMSNLYAGLGMWDGVRTIRELIKDRGMRKEIGKSEIEVDGEIQEFVSGEMLKDRKEGIEMVIWSLCKTGMSAEHGLHYELSV